MHRMLLFQPNKLLNFRQGSSKMWILHNVLYLGSWIFLWLIRVETCHVEPNIHFLNLPKKIPLFCQKNIPLKSLVAIIITITHPCAQGEPTTRHLNIQPAFLGLPTILDLSAVWVLYQGDVEQSPEHEGTVRHPPHSHWYCMQQTVAISCRKMKRNYC